VLIPTEEEREAIRERVVRGIEHVLELHRKYPDGVPALYNEKDGSYEIRE